MFGLLFSIQNSVERNLEFRRGDAKFISHIRSSNTSTIDCHFQFVSTETISNYFISASVPDSLEIQIQTVVNSFILLNFNDGVRDNNNCLSYCLSYSVLKPMYAPEEGIISLTAETQQFEGSANRVVRHGLAETRPFLQFAFGPRIPLRCPHRESSCDAGVFKKM